MTNVAFITFLDGTEEEVRNYSSVNELAGGMAFLWSDTDVEVWYNTSVIKSISFQREDVTYDDPDGIPF